MGKSVLFRAPSIALSGYSVHSRQIARYLFNKEKEYDLDIFCETLNWGNCPFILDRDMYNGLIGKIMDCTGEEKRKQLFDVAIQIQLPNEWDPRLAKFNIGVTAGVETTLCNPEWVNCVNRMDLVIVPSQFTKDTFLRSGNVKTEILVIPESFPDEVFDNTIPALDINLDKQFYFFINAQLTGPTPETCRKNLFYSIKYLVDVFHNDPDVGVIIKSNSSRNSKIDRLHTENLFNKVLSECKVSANPQFLLLHGNLDEREMIGLYRHPKIKGFFSATRGEGFSLGALQSAACDIPVLATNWSAHTEFLNLGKWIKFDYDLINLPPARIDNQIFVSHPDNKWANPREADVKQKLLKFRNSPDLPKQWAKELGVKIREKYSFGAIEKIYEEKIGEYLK